MAYCTLQLKWELKGAQELSEWLTKPFCTLPGELMGELTVISMSDLSAFKLQCEVFNIIFGPSPIEALL